MPNVAHNPPTAKPPTIDTGVLIESLDNVRYALRRLCTFAELAFDLVGEMPPASGMKQERDQERLHHVLTIADECASESWDLLDTIADKLGEHGERRAVRE